MQKHAISWLEIPVNDFNRAKGFYSAIFDYEMPEMVVNDHRLGFLPHDGPNGGVGGAIFEDAESRPSPDGVRVYLNGGKDLGTILSRVEAAGGQVVLEKTCITPEIGYYATFQDTEGNHISLHSPA